MKQKTMNLRNHYIVCGYGHVGQRIADLLAHLGYNVVAISQLPFSSYITNKKIHIIFADAREVSTLQKANIAQARGIAIVTDDDATNIAIALAAYQLNPHIRIALRIFDLQLGKHFANAIPHCNVYSTSAIAAPIFTAASKGKHIISAFTNENSLWIIEKNEKISIRKAPQIDYKKSKMKKTGIILNSIIHWWRNSPTPLKIAIKLLLVIFILSMIIFHFVLNLSLIDAIYFTITIITTVGFGDINLLQAPWYLKLYGILTMIGGTFLLAIIFSITTDLLLSFRLRDVFPFLNRSYKDHIIVAGAGNIGSRVIKELLDEGESVIAIEQNDESASATFSFTNLPILKGNAASEDLLHKAHIHTAKAIIAVTNSDIVNLCVALIAKKYNVPTIIARIFDKALLDSSTHAINITAAFSVSACAAPAFVASLLYSDAIHGFIDSNTFYIVFKKTDDCYSQDVIKSFPKRLQKIIAESIHESLQCENFCIVKIPLQ